MLAIPVQPHNSLNTITTSIKAQPNSKGHAKLPRVKSFKKIPPLTRKVSRPKKNTSLARRKILLEMKFQKTMRKNINKKLQSTEEHEKGLIQRKQVLVDILEKYEQLSRDRYALSAEIKKMKGYLSDIRLKLNRSLSVLNKNTNLIAMKRRLTAKMLANLSDSKK